MVRKTWKRIVDIKFIVGNGPRRRSLRRKYTCAWQEVEQGSRNGRKISQGGWMELAVDVACFESENVGGVVGAAARGHRIETNNCGHCDHRRELE